MLWRYPPLAEYQAHCKKGTANMAVIKPHRNKALSCRPHAALNCGAFHFTEYLHSTVCPVLRDTNPQLDPDTHPITTNSLSRDSSSASSQRVYDNSQVKIGGR